MPPSSAATGFRLPLAGCRVPHERGSAGKANPHAPASPDTGRELPGALQPRSPAGARQTQRPDRLVVPRGMRDQSEFACHPLDPRLPARDNPCAALFSLSRPAFIPAFLPTSLSPVPSALLTARSATSACARSWRFRSALHPLPRHVHRGSAQPARPDPAPAADTAPATETMVADSGGGAPAGRLPSIVVTATRSPERIEDLVADVSVIDGDLGRRGLNLQEVLRFGGGRAADFLRRAGSDQQRADPRRQCRPHADAVRRLPGLVRACSARRRSRPCRSPTSSRIELLRGPASAPLRRRRARRRRAALRADGAPGPAGHGEAAAGQEGTRQLQGRPLRRFATTLSGGILLSRDSSDGFNATTPAQLRLQPRPRRLPSARASRPTAMPGSAPARACAASCCRTGWISRLRRRRLSPVPG